MRNCLWALISLFFLFTACNNEEYLSVDAPRSAGSSTEMRFYGVGNSEKSTRGVAQKNNLWHNGTTVKIKFLNDPYSLQEKVKTFASEWGEHANIKFEYVTSGDADVRIGFDWGGERYVSWSYTGTDCKNVTNQNEATMNFGSVDGLPDDDLRADVLRAYGQMLGLELEHRHIEFMPTWTEASLKSYWEDEIDDIPWASLKKYVFDPLEESDNIVATKEYDKLSIMQWPFPRKVLPGSTGNFDLSEQDVMFIKQLYPKGAEKATILTFTEKVDLTMDGILVEGNVKIKADGVLVYEGHVSAAPQTVSGTVFEFVAKKLQLVGYESESVCIPKKLKSLHIVDAEYGKILLSGQPYLTDITSDGIPYLSHTDYSSMFESSALNSIPETLFGNAPNVKNLSNAFAMCRSLTSIPQNLLSGCPNVEILENVFGGTGIISIPETLFANCFKGRNFTGIFAGCFNLETIPPRLFANCSAGSFYIAFEGCQKLTSLPKELFIGCSKAADFSFTFMNCHNLEIIPEDLFAYSVDAYLFHCTFTRCNLKAIPEGLFSKCHDVINFIGVFSENENLKNIPEKLFIYCTKAENFTAAFSHCTSLMSIPENLFTPCVKAIDFTSTFNECFSVTSKVPELWKTHPDARPYDCFSGATKAQNYADIPSKWKNWQ